MKHTIFLVLVLTLLALAGTVRAQDPPDAATVVEPSPPTPPLAIATYESFRGQATPATPTGMAAFPRFQGATTFSNGQGGYGVIVGQQPHPSPLDDVMRAYHEAKTDDEKNQAKQDLQKELERQYDAFIENQTKQVDDLAERLAKLKEQLQKRRDAKSRMVDLKLQMVLNQADGLIFPDGPNGPQGPNAFGGDALFAPGQPGTWAGGAPQPDQQGNVPFQDTRPAGQPRRPAQSPPHGGVR